MFQVSATIAVLLLSGGVGIIAFELATKEAKGPVLLGMRGLRRRDLLEKGGLLAALDPLVRWIARWIRLLSLQGTRVRIEKRLREAGDWAGYDAYELIALSSMCAFAGGVAALFAVRSMDAPGVFVPFGVGLGFFLPFNHVSGSAARRQREINRSLPAAVDLIALAMSAGLDFVAAVHHVVDVSRSHHRSLTEELEYVTRQMSLGVARHRALEELALRVPIEPVRNFVGAIQQSEQKGTPLADTLKQQAATLRNRRSVQGEEAASRAAALMMIPLVLVMGSILVVLMSPFLIRGMDAGL